MDINTDIRLKQLQSLDNFISYSRDKVQSILDCLKWNVGDTLKETSLVRCSVDPNHRVSSKSLDAHIENCLLHKEGYDKEDSFLSEPVNNSTSAIKIDNYKKVEIFTIAPKTIPEFKSGWNGFDPDPRTGDRLLTAFSPDERLVLYNYAASNTSGPPQLPEFNISQPVNIQGKSLTEEELLRRERDAKRRRIKYKSVHTNRKNHTEIIREVINGQMDLYCDWIKSTQDNASGEEDNVRYSENTKKDTTRYADSVGKHSTHSESSNATKHNGDSYSNSRSGEQAHHSRERDHSEGSHRTEKHYKSDYRSHRQSDRHSDHSSGAYKRRRSSERYDRKRRRSRSRSRHKHYSRNRR